MQPIKNNENENCQWTRNVNIKFKNLFSKKKASVELHGAHGSLKKFKLTYKRETVLKILKTICISDILLENSLKYLEAKFTWLEALFFIH